jgi:hypothetical protein
MVRAPLWRPPVADARPCQGRARAMFALRQQHIALDSSSTPIPCLVTAALARQNLPLALPNDVSRVSTGNTPGTREPSLLAPARPLATVICHRRTLLLRTWDPDCEGGMCCSLPTLQLPPESCELLCSDSPDTTGIGQVRMAMSSLPHQLPNACQLFSALHPSAMCLSEWPLHSTSNSCRHLPKFAKFPDQFPALGSNKVYPAQHGHERTCRVQNTQAVRVFSFGRRE